MMRLSAVVEDKKEIPVMRDVEREVPEEVNVYTK